MQGEPLGQIFLSSQKWSNLLIFLTRGQKKSEFDKFDVLLARKLNFFLEAKLEQAENPARTVEKRRSVETVKTLKQLKHSLVPLSNPMRV